MIIKSSLWVFNNSLCFSSICMRCVGFPGGTGGKESTANAGDIRDRSLTPRLRRSPGGVHCNPFQYSWLQNPMDWGTWCTTVHRVAKSQTWPKQLSVHAWDIYSKSAVLDSLDIAPFVKLWLICFMLLLIFRVCFFSCLWFCFIIM